MRVTPSTSPVRLGPLFEIDWFLRREIDVERTEVKERIYGNGFTFRVGTTSHGL